MAEYKDEVFDNSCPVRIMVMGVGGGGNNAVDRMVKDGITDVEFVAVNTDKQALSCSHAKKKLVIGEKLTRGFGAGADPVKGAQAAEESKDQIRALLKDVDMLFLTAGMGGGTGTGAMPVIAAIANELNILTVAVVTKPFHFEGTYKMNNALQGIDKLKNIVDTLVVIPNEKLMDILPKDATLKQGFKIADDVLKNGIAGITNVITKRLEINLDFADINTVMRGKGMAHMGVGEAEGDGKVIRAVRDAVASPLLDTRIEGATGIIVCFIGDKSIPLHEVNEALGHVRSIANENVNLIFGVGFDDSTEFEDKVRVVLIATGFNCVDENSEHRSTTTSDAVTTPLGASKRIVPEAPVSRVSSETRADDGEYNIDFPEEPRAFGGASPRTDAGSRSSSGAQSGRISIDEADMPPFIRKLKRRGLDQ